MTKNTMHVQKRQVSDATTLARTGKSYYDILTISRRWLNTPSGQ